MNHKFLDELFPGILETINLDQTLIVNCWDPHSVPGNGNGADASLDGQMGRCSMIGRLGWGVTNSLI